MSYCQLRKDVLPKNECFGKLLSCRFAKGPIDSSSFQMIYLQNRLRIISYVYLEFKVRS